MAKNKKIILTVTTDLNYDQRMQRICKSLSDASYDVLLIGREKAESIPLKQQAYKQHRIKMLAQKGALFYLFYNLRLFFLLLSKSTDIICAVDLDTVLAVGLVKRLRPRLKVVFDAHEYFTEVPELQGRNRIKKIWNLIGDLFIPSFNAAYTVGPELAKLFTDQYGINFKTIRNLSVYRSSEKIAKSNRSFVLYYQGALNAGRGLEQMINAMELLDDSICLHLAGEGDLSDELRSLVKTKNLQGRVKFLGYLRPEDLQKPLQEADLGLNLLEDKGLSYYYSLANKTFDYIQVELPAVHMAFPEYKALQKQWDCFYLLESLETGELAKCIQMIVKDKEQYLRKQDACQKAKKDLSWELESRSLINLYNQL